MRPQALNMGDGRLPVGYAQGVCRDGFWPGESEQTVDRHAEPPGRKVVHGVVESRQRGRGNRVIAREGALDVPGVPGLDALQSCRHPLCVLAVVVRGCRLAPARDAVFRNLEDYALEGVCRAAGNREGALGVHFDGRYARLQVRPLLHSIRIAL
jgi:hypothetical protein